VQADGVYILLNYEKCSPSVIGGEKTFILLFA